MVEIVESVEMEDLPNGFKQRISSCSTFGTVEIIESVEMGDLRNCLMNEFNLSQDRLKPT